MKDSDFRTLFANERERFINYVRSLLSEAAELDAEDVVHDVMVKILERGDSMPPLEYLAAYVFRSLRNRVIDSSRTQKKLLSIDADQDETGAEQTPAFAEALTDLRPGVADQLQSDQCRHALFDALTQLTSIEQKVIIGHEFEGLTFREISSASGIGINTLLSHKARAIKKLKAILADGGPVKRKGVKT